MFQALQRRLGAASIPQRRPLRRAALGGAVSGVLLSALLTALPQHPLSIPTALGLAMALLVYGQMLKKLA